VDPDDPLRDARILLASLAERQEMVTERNIEAAAAGRPVLEHLLGEVENAATLDDDQRQRVARAAAQTVDAPEQLLALSREQLELTARGLPLALDDPSALVRSAATLREQAAMIDAVALMVRIAAAARANGLID
jgi:hypothetical protein